MKTRNMDWVETSPYKDALTRIYWSSPARLTREEFERILSFHGDQICFKHPTIHPFLVKAGVMGSIFGKLIFELK